MGSKLTCIPQTDDKYISFSLGRLGFIDICQFMQASLESLVASTPPKTFKATRKFESNVERFALSQRKGVYPYEYMDSTERFNETSSTQVSLLQQAEGRHQRCRLRARPEGVAVVWDKEPWRVPRPLHEYRRGASGWRFRGVPQDLHDALRPWPSALLHSSRSELERALEAHQGHDWAPNGLRQAPLHREGCTWWDQHGEQALHESNNPYVECYDPSQPTKYITYLDANNIYGWAMCQPSPSVTSSW